MGGNNVCCDRPGRVETARNFIVLCRIEPDFTKMHAATSNYVDVQIREDLKAPGSAATNFLVGARHGCSFTDLMTLATASSIRRP